MFWSLHPIFTLLAATWMRPQWVFVRSTAADFNAVRYTISTHFNMAWFETKISWLSRCKYNFSQHLDHESLAAISTKYQHKLQRKHWSDTCRYPVCPYYEPKDPIQDGKGGSFHRKSPLVHVPHLVEVVLHLCSGVFSGPSPCGGPPHLPLHVLPPLRTWADPSICVESEQVKSGLNLVYFTQGSDSSAPISTWNWWMVMMRRQKSSNWQIMITGF